MKSKTKKILGGVISLIIIASISIYFIWNPLGASNEKLADGTTLSSGNLVEMDSSHWGKGEVRIVELTSDQSLEVHFIDVEIAQGPDLYIYLSSKDTFSGINDVSGSLYDLGKLPYNEGTFAVEIPEGTDLTNVKSVLIWCVAFSVIFSYAALT